MTDTTTPELSAVQVAQDLRYCEQLEAHMKNGCTTGEGNVRDLIGMVRNLATRPSAPADALVEALREIEEFTSKADGGLDGVLNFICKKALAAHTASSTGAGWQPIETAPKDGTTILFFDPNTESGGGGVFEGCWVDEMWSDYADNFERTPTHWMSLPQPPLPAAPADRGNPPGSEWRDIISAPRNGKLIKLAWWAADQWVSTHGRYVRSHDCWVDEENFRLDPKMWAPADPEPAAND